MTYPAFLPCAMAALIAWPTAAMADDARGVRQPTLTPQVSGTGQGLIAVSPVDEQVVWASGRGGSFVLTTDGGQTWKPGVVPGAETLQFRDVQGVSDKIAYLQSIGGNPGDFRIYKTQDGGASWTMQFQNQNPGAFYDCFAFWTAERGLTHSDSVNGVFPDLRTRDGRQWQDISAAMPLPLAGESSFAASGTCVATQGLKNAWIATGGSTTARVLATRDGGDTWAAYDTPLISNASAGAFSIAFRNGRHGIVGGGDLAPGDPSNARTAVSGDGGKTWTLTTAPPVSGAIFGLAYASETRLLRGRHATDEQDDDDAGGAGGRTVVVTANAGGAAWTPDEGRTWYPLTGVTGYWAVAFASRRVGWLVGVNGSIQKIVFP